MLPSLAVRARYAALAVATIALGLLVHGSGGALSPVVRDVLGDALWAIMLAWWVGAIVPTMPLLRRGALALALCFAVEFSQLLHPPGLEALRRTIAGQLVLGSGFDPRDLAVYAVGVLAAVILEQLVVRRNSEP